MMSTIQYRPTLTLTLTQSIDRVPRTSLNFAGRRNSPTVRRAVLCQAQRDQHSETKANTRHAGTHVHHARLAHTDEQAGEQAGNRRLRGRITLFPPTTVPHPIALHRLGISISVRINGALTFRHVFKSLSAYRAAIHIMVFYNMYMMAPDCIQSVLIRSQAAMPPGARRRPSFLGVFYVHADRPLFLSWCWGMHKPPLAILVPVMRVMRRTHTHLSTPLHAQMQNPHAEPDPQPTRKPLQNELPPSKAKPRPISKPNHRARARVPARKVVLVGGSGLRRRRNVHDLARRHIAAAKAREHAPDATELLAARRRRRWRRHERNLPGRRGRGGCRG